MTTFTILKSEPVQDGEEDLWRYEGLVEAQTSEAAIRKYVEATAEGGTFVAVAMRRFVPKVVALESVMKVKLS